MVALRGRGQGGAMHSCREGRLVWWLRNLYET